MTPAKAAPRKAPARTSSTPKPAKKVAKTPARKGAAAGKKAAKPPVKGRRRAGKGAEPTAGARLRADLEHDGDPIGVTLLIRQAARVVDRLDVIDKALTGDESLWLKLSLPRSDEKRGRVLVECKVDGLVVEERNLTTLLRHVLREIDRQRGNNGGGGDDDGDDDLVD